MIAPSTPSRRAVLVAGLVAPLVACTRSAQPPAPVAGSSPAAPTGPGVGPRSRPDADAPVRAAAVARERRLLAAYDAALADDPGARDLAALRQEHAAHLQALGVAPPPPPPGDRRRRDRRAAARARAGLVRAERGAAGEHARDLLTASRGLAAVLASLAAAEASHLVVLEPDGR